MVARRALRGASGRNAWQAPQRAGVQWSGSAGHLGRHVGLLVKPENRIGMGSARASRAVFRALAENLERTKVPKILIYPTRKVLDARRVQPHPRAGALPIPVFR